MGCLERQYKELQRCAYEEYGRIAIITKDEFIKCPIGTFPVAFEDTRPLYGERSVCPLSFFRNMMKREEPTYNKRFLCFSYTLDSHGEGGYVIDVDIGRVDGSVKNLFNGVFGREYTSEVLHILMCQSMPVSWNPRGL